MSTNLPVYTANTLATKKVLKADVPTWCPGCGDFGVLSVYAKLLEKRELLHKDVISIAGIGCSSRFPYFVNAHGVHFLHGRALPLASGISLTRPDLHVFVFGGDGDAFSIGGNHLEHAARRNINLTYVIMDNFVYGLTKAQTSPTSPIGFKSKTDPLGNKDTPVNPISKLITAGATFIGRTITYDPGHMMELFERAMDHNGFSVLEILSECTEFNRGSFDGASPRRGGEMKLIDETKHDVTDTLAAYKLGLDPFPGWFGVFYEEKKTTRNEHEQNFIKALDGDGKVDAQATLQKYFNTLK